MSHQVFSNFTERREYKSFPQVDKRFGASRTADKVLTVGIANLIDWDTATYDDFSVSGGVITIKKSGTYYINSVAAFESSIVGSRYSFVLVNLDNANPICSVMAQSITTVDGVPFSITGKDTVFLKSGDTVSMFVGQSSGGDLSLLCDTGALNGFKSYLHLSIV